MMKKAATAVLTAVFWLGLWEVIALAFHNKILLPTVGDTLKALLTLAVRGETWASVGGSLLRVAAGFSLGAVIGCLAGAVSAASGFMNTLLTPITAAVKATPVASFIILAFVWIDIGFVPVFTAFLVVAPIFLSGVYTACRTVEPKLLEMARAFRMPLPQKLTKIYIPHIFPSLLGSVSSCVGMAWKSGVAAEVICRSKASIGGSLYEAKILINTDEVFAWTAIVILLSLLCEKAVIFAVRKLGGASGGLFHG